MTDTPENRSDFWRLAGLEDYVAIDLETTGLDPDTDSIIELGAVRFRDGKFSDSFCQLVNPRRPLLPFITELTGIRDADLKDAPLLKDVAGEFIDFVGGSQLVGHNIAFDLGFLAADQSTSSHFTRNRVVPLTHDTGLTVRFVHPCLDGYGLSHLVERFRIRSKTSHRAKDDADATGRLFSLLLNDLAAVELNQLNTGFHFVEGTASPLANTLRAVRQARLAGFEPGRKAPDAMKGPSADRTNTYRGEGDKRPDQPYEARLMKQLFNDLGRFRTVLPEYQVRTEQVDMAVAAADSFREDLTLIAEAGTGVGKSLGYLVPALLSGRRVIISTHTKNLQDQLFYDEIPRLGKLFKFGFSAAVLKGRRNYICRNKWKSWAIAPERIAAPALREKAALISRWVEATQTGDIAEIGAVNLGFDAGFFSLVASEAGYCGGRGCGEAQNCPLMKIRRFALKADLLVVNHSLVMSDLLSGGGVLGDFGRIVFDEAHHLEDVATDQYGSDLTAPALRAALERVNRLCRRNSELWVRLAGMGSLKRLSDIAEKAAADAGELSGVTSQLFDQARALFASRVGSNAVYSESFRYRTGDRIHLVLQQAGASLYSGLNPLQKSLAQIRMELQDLAEEDFPAQLLQELQAALEMISEQLDSLKLSLTGDDPNRVYWVEIPADVNRSVRLRSAPLDVSELLAGGLWKRLSSAILTSATLATDPLAGGFDHIVSRLGLDRLDAERLRTARFGSPFDFENNCLVCYPAYIASPADEYEQHCHQVAEVCADLALKHKRNTLVLFTSYNAMQYVEKDLKQATLADGVEILVQGKPGGNERLVRRFRKSSGALLMGTDALWEGIDIPGEALEIVVIPRLPFGMPGDPVIAARIDRIRETGGNPFYDYQLPQAILKLRQGSGRLIRTTSDRGVVIILDPRAVTKGYGAQFRRSLPGKSVILKDQAELNESIGSFFVIGGTTDGG